MFKRVLVPLDGSRTSSKSIPYAIEIAKSFSAETLLLQVVPYTPLVTPADPMGGSVMASPTATKIIMETAKEEEKRKMIRAQRYLRRKLKEVKSHGIEGNYFTMLGEPAKMIIKFCQEKSIDLVVMTTSGKSGLKRAFLGSVADYVIREPGIPVLVIRPKRQPIEK